MNKFYIVSTILILSTIHSTAQSWEWVKNIDLGAVEKGVSIGVDKEGNAYVAGYTNETYAGDGGAYYNSLFYKLDTAGNELWLKDIWVWKSVTDFEGNTYLIRGNGEVGKYDKDGNELWVKSVPNAIFEKVALVPGGGVVVSGRNFQDKGSKFECNTLTGDNRFFRARFDKNGNCIWAKETDTFSSTSIVVGTNNKIYASGSGLPDNDGNRPWVEIYNLSDGNLLKGIRGDSKHCPKEISNDSENNIFIIEGVSTLNPLTVNGRTYNHNGFCIIKYDSEGEIIWVKEIESPQISQLKIATNRDNDLFIIGHFNEYINVDQISLNCEERETFILKMDGKGNAKWIKSSTGTGDGENIYPTDMVVNSKGDVYVTGVIQGEISFDSFTLNATNSSPYPDMFIGKISDGQDEPTTIKVNEEHGNILNIYPNPTRGNLIIDYQAENINVINLKIRNLTGAVIYEATEQNSFGTFQKEIEIGKHSPGIYFVDLVTDKERLVRKILINH